MASPYEAILAATRRLHDATPGCICSPKVHVVQDAEAERRNEVRLVAEHEPDCEAGR